MALWRVTVTWLEQQEETNEIEAETEDDAYAWADDEYAIYDDIEVDVEPVVVK